MFYKIEIKSWTISAIDHYYYDIPYLLSSRFLEGVIIALITSDFILFYLFGRNILDEVLSKILVGFEMTLFSLIFAFFYLKLLLLNLFRILTSLYFPIFFWDDDGTTWVRVVSKLTTNFFLGSRSCCGECWVILDYLSIFIVCFLFLEQRNRIYNNLIKLSLDFSFLV